MNALIKPLCLTGLYCGLVLLAACETTRPVKVKVDAISDMGAREHRTCVLTPARPEIAVDDAQYQVIAAEVRAALAARGLTEVDDLGEADMNITIDFGVGEPFAEVAYRSVPIYEIVQPPPHTEMVDRVRGDGSIQKKRVEIQDPPQRQKVGQKKEYYDVVVYPKYLELRAHETEGAAPAELWKVHVKSVDENSDLDPYLPSLSAAAIRYLDQNTGGLIEIKM